MGSKIDTINALYEAFGQGDLDTILASLADDVDWAVEANPETAPWYGVRKGKDGVASFFSDFGSTMEVQEFVPYALAENDTEVLSVVRMRATARSTGKQVAFDLHHYFRFADGKIAFYRGTEDSAQVAAALSA